MVFVPVFSASCPPSPPSPSPLRKEGVRCSSRPLLWTQELGTILLQQQGHLPLTSMAPYAMFAPSFVEAMLMQPFTLLSQLGLVATFVLNLSLLPNLQFCTGTRAFHSIFTVGPPFFPLPGSCPLSPCMGISTSAAPSEPAGCQARSATATAT